MPTDSYETFVREAKDRILAAQVRAGFAVNREQMALYWQIGKTLAAQSEQDSGSDDTLRRFAADLKAAFPGVTGFSEGSLSLMRQFYRACPDEAAFAALPLAKIPWGHNILLLEKVSDPARRLWYADRMVWYRWNRAVFNHVIDTDLALEQGKPLPKPSYKPRTDVAPEVLTDPYTFEFLALDPASFQKRQTWTAVGSFPFSLMKTVPGLSLVGSRYRLEVEGKSHYLDHLYYHLTLRCFVVTYCYINDAEGLIGDFVERMTFYLSSVDDLLRHPSDAPSIGLLMLMTDEWDRFEYVLRDTETSGGSDGFRLTDTLPPELSGSLPSLQRIKREVFGIGDAEPV